MRQPKLERRPGATVQVVPAECATQEREPKVVVVGATPVVLAAMVRVVVAHREAWPQPADERRAELAETARVEQPVDVVLAERPAAVARAARPVDVDLVEQPVAVALPVDVDRAVQAAAVARAARPVDVDLAEQPVVVAVEPVDAARVEPPAGAAAAAVEVPEDPAAHPISV